MIRRGFTYVSVGRPVEYPSDDSDLFVGTENLVRNGACDERRRL